VLHLLHSDYTWLLLIIIIVNPQFIIDTLARVLRLLSTLTTYTYTPPTLYSTLYQHFTHFTYTRSPFSSFQSAISHQHSHFPTHSSHVAHHPSNTFASGCSHLPHPGMQVISHTASSGSPTSHFFCTSQSSHLHHPFFHPRHIKPPIFSNKSSVSQFQSLSQP